MIYIVASLTDFYDGYYARKYGYVTKRGKFLDPLADKILMSAVLFSFYILGYVQLWVVLVIVIRDFLITGLRSYALFKKHPVVTSNIARFKTAVLMTSAILVFLYILADQLAITNQTEYYIINRIKDAQVIEIMMAMVAIFTAYTGIKYFIDNRTHLKTFLKSCYSIFSATDD